MKKIRTASVRATTAEIEAEQNEKRQRNNSPRLTIVKIVLTHQTGAILHLKTQFVSNII